jgi:cytochrome c oxidase assembly protein subunit 15
MPFSVRSINSSNPWLHRFAVLTALATLALIGIGGLVTSHEAGMAVPDWPTSYGYNMFALPIKFWKGGVFYEHTHRLWATIVGTLVVALTRWLGGYASRRPLAIIGLIEILAGIGIFLLLPDLKGTGHFLTGIGGVVLLAALVWVKNEPVSQTLTRLGWLAFGLVQFQGLLGGLRVVLFRDQIGIFHAALAQIFFVLLCIIAAMTSRRWDESLRALPIAVPRALRYGIIAATLMIFGQLVLGATMRHQHAGLAISDFPLAYGKLWPATDAESIARYNQQRIEVTLANPITAFQIELQMAHRIMAVLILAAVAFCVWQARSFGFSRSGPPEGGTPNILRQLAFFWLALILVQATLGAATVLLGKAADIATAHVLFGALSLANGVLLCIIATGFNLEKAKHANFLSRADSRPEDSGSFAATTSAR